MRIEQITIGLLLFSAITTFGLLGLCGVLTRGFLAVSCLSISIGFYGMFSTFDVTPMPIWTLLIFHLILIGTLILMILEARKQLPNNFLILGVLHGIVSMPLTFLRSLFKPLIKNGGSRKE